MFTLHPLPYDYNALEPYIDEQTMRLHHDKHHAAYVANLNEVLAGHSKFLNLEIEELIKNLEKIPQEIRTKVRNNGGGHANHTLFWHVMSPPAGGGGGQPSGELAESIKSTFGDFAIFKEKMTAAGMGRFGSGWAWLIINKGKLEILDTPNQDSPLMESSASPILALDVWEHAYYLKYQNRRAEYIENWWNVVNWAEVSKRFEEAIK